MLIDEITFIFNGFSLTLVIDVDSMGRSDDTLIYYALVTKMLPVSADVTIVLQSILNLNSNKSESKLNSLESFTLCDRCDGNKTLAPTSRVQIPLKPIITVKSARAAVWTASMGIGVSSRLTQFAIWRARGVKLAGVNARASGYAALRPARGDARRLTC